ncbi:hypothetical protein JKF63_03554 [Porcisia hertigi]|uniref:Haloacid dehalogenase-like hydrolase-like protein n=1 Tax=Porcisia hertigi TaxID=2761500 RepID=A0A836HWR6_9TRYP|nr:hypothetical protein JKF63_03554 [Porcisia hertigi]
MVPLKIKAVFVDMDGTLLDSHHLISMRTVNVLHALKEQGVALIVATGRPYPDVFANLTKANLNPSFIITSNGARVHDAQHNTIFACDMNAESVCQLFQLPLRQTDDGVIDMRAPTPQISYNINCRDRWFTNKYIPEYTAAFHPSFRPEQVNPMEQTADTLKGTHSVWLRGAHTDLASVKQYVERELSDHIGCAFALPYVLDCFPAGMNKRLAMDKVCKHLGIHHGETIAFGDGMNDVELLTAAGQGFVMANAAEMVKQAAAHLPVIHSNDEDGVALKLEELLAADAFGGCWQNSESVPSKSA